jgi:hypothetical protein
MARGFLASHGRHIILPVDIQDMPVEIEGFTPTIGFIMKG